LTGQIPETWSIAKLIIGPTRQWQGKSANHGNASGSKTLSLNAAIIKAIETPKEAAGPSGSQVDAPEEMYTAHQKQKGVMESKKQSVSAPETSDQVKEELVERDGNRNPKEMHQSSSWSKHHLPFSREKSQVPKGGYFAVGGVEGMDHHPIRVLLLLQAPVAQTQIPDQRLEIPHQVNPRQTTLVD
jgi:hypothetical protein